jgi:4-hydroxy-tetrahydrodipicolinate reductase
MIKVIINGCSGRMGQVISKLIEDEPDMQVVAGFCTKDCRGTYPIYSNPNDCNEEADVIIDFSNPLALGRLVEYCLTRGIPLITATTGFSDEQFKILRAASEKIPIFQSANMSLGIHLVKELVEKSAKVLFDKFDIEIVEKHHNQKIDAPSGTAVMLAEAINDVLPDRQEYIYERHSTSKKRTKNEIGIHSIRGGTIVGEHTVVFAGNDEIIEITHSAVSRKAFGDGAIKAAKFILGKQPGYYTMKDLINY